MKQIYTTVMFFLMMTFFIPREAIFDNSLFIPFQLKSRLSQGRNTLPKSADFQEEHSIYLPILLRRYSQFRAPRVNVPRFQGEIPFDEMAIFWFGKITLIDNYSDVRIAYNSEEIYIRLAAFDRRLWYDNTPTSEDLKSWDAFSLFLSLSGNQGVVPDSNTFHFVGQLNPHKDQPHDDYQKAFIGNGSTYQQAPLSFQTEMVWRGNSLNDDVNDRGWAIKIRIPYESLGLSGPPKDGTTWGLAVHLHDRDDQSGSPIADQSWPESADELKPRTWGQMVFGLPGYSHQDVVPEGSTLIRNKRDGVTVQDGMVGGGTVCGDGLDFWNEWGEANYVGAKKVNIQNQYDVADWPCFSKYYLTFPLDTVPAGKVIHSAKLTLYQFGNSEPGLAQPSFIQVLTTNSAWEEGSISWNNAPLADENQGGVWVDPLLDFPEWPGVPREWDISRAVAEQYNARLPLSLVLYSADAPMHSGKYFSSSDVEDWNDQARPTLTVVWGDSLTP